MRWLSVAAPHDSDTDVLVVDLTVMAPTEEGAIESSGAWVVVLTGAEGLDATPFSMAATWYE